VESAYGDKAYSISEINRIRKAVKEGKNTSDHRHSNLKKTTRTTDVMAAVPAAVEDDQRVMVSTLTERLCLAFGNAHFNLTEDQGMQKKSACWVLKLRSPKQKKGSSGSHRLLN